MRTSPYRALSLTKTRSILAGFLSAAPMLVALAAVLAFGSIGIAQQSKPSKKHAKTPPAPAAPVAIPVPFHSGENLEYRVLFSKYSVNAAKIETTVVEQRNFFGQPSWHFRAVAHTQDTTRALFAIDDEFDSYTAVANLFSLQYEMYLHEQGKAQTNLYRMTTGNDPAPADVTAVRVAPGTRDAISFLYNVRAADWQRAPELKAPVFDGHRLYDAVARVDTPQGTVTVPAGNFPAFRVAIALFDHGKELTDTRLWVWITKDAAHTPVLVEAEIPFGTARIELTHLP
ncbi:MAG TPA: DUF3108 domain-containing protein [Candidatus Acidoferrales bacterium]|nr:DUF3108 domain-containing protein [Candidatus Acidoferrales bacterium]